MKDKARRLIRPADLIVAAAALAVAALLWLAFGGMKGTVAEIVCEKEVVETVDLSAVKEAYDIPLDNGVTVAVKPGAIRFAASDCANQLCVHTGKLTKL